MREYAQERLDASGETVRSAAPTPVISSRSRGGGRAHLINTSTGFTRLAAERDNLRAALRWSLDEGDPTLALECAMHWSILDGARRLREGDAWTEAALEKTADAGPYPRACALYNADCSAGRWASMSGPCSG